MFVKCDAGRSFCLTCLSRESILRKSMHGGSWEGHYAPPGLHYGCIMPIPSLQLQKKPVLYREAEGLVAELWSPGLIKEYSDLRCFYVTTAKQWIILEIEHLTTVGLEVGLPAFELPMFAKCDYCRCQEEICFACLFRLKNLSLHSLPVAWCSWELVFYS